LDFKLVRSDQTQSTSKLKLWIIGCHWLDQQSMNRERDCIIISCTERTLQCNDVDCTLHHCQNLYCLNIIEPSNFRRLRKQISPYYPNSSYIKGNWTMIDSIPFVRPILDDKTRIRLPLQPGIWAPGFVCQSSRWLRLCNLLYRCNIRLSSLFWGRDIKQQLLYVVLYKLDNNCVSSL